MSDCWGPACIFHQQACGRESKRHVLYRPKADLNEWINQGPERALFASLCFCLDVTSSSQNNAPEVNTMNILPVVHLFVRFLAMEAQVK